MNLNHLKYFSVLAKTEHYAKAAQMLFITQPTLSYSIHAIEKELGVILFEKDGRNVKLTEEGKIFAEHVDRALSEIEMANALIRKQEKLPEETIIIQLTRQWYLQPLFNTFKSSRQHSNIHMQISQAHSFDVYNGLTEGRCQIGFSSVPFHDPNLDCIRMRDYDMVLIVPQTHRWAKLRSFDLRSLGEEPVVMKDTNTELGRRAKAMYQAAGITPNVIGTSRTYHLLAEMVSEGMGVGICQHSAFVSTLPLSFLPLSYPDPRIYFYLLTRKDTPLSPGAQALIAFLKAHQQTFDGV